MAALMVAPHRLALAAAATAVWCGGDRHFLSRLVAVAGRADGARPSRCSAWLAATFWSPRTPMSRSLRLILLMLGTICVMALLLGAVAHLACWVRQRSRG
jgi:hypothetical protein